MKSVTLETLWVSIRDYLWPGGIGAAIGAAICGFIVYLRGRVKEIEYSVNHARLGLSADDRIHGSIRVQWKNRDLQNLYSSTVTVENTASEDYENLKITVYSGESVFILSEQVEVSGSTHVPEISKEFLESLRVADGGSLTERQLALVHHRREYSVPVLNRGDKAFFRYLTTVPNGEQPALWVDILRPGLKATHKSLEPYVFGAPTRWAMLVGLVTCLVVLFAVGYRSGDWKSASISMIAGLAVLPIGAGLYRMVRAIKRIVLH